VVILPLSVFKSLSTAKCLFLKDFYTPPTPSPREKYFFLFKKKEQPFPIALITNAVYQSAVKGYAPYR